MEWNFFMQQIKNIQKIDWKTLKGMGQDDKKKSYDTGQMLMKVSHLRHNLIKTLRFNQKIIERSPSSTLSTTYKGSCIMF